MRARAQCFTFGHAILTWHTVLWCWYNNPETIWTFQAFDFNIMSNVMSILDSSRLQLDTHLTTRRLITLITGWKVGNFRLLYLQSGEHNIVMFVSVGSLKL